MLHEFWENVGAYVVSAFRRTVVVSG